MQESKLLMVPQLSVRGAEVHFTMDWLTRNTVQTVTRGSQLQLTVSQRYLSASTSHGGS